MNAITAPDTGTCRSCGNPGLEVVLSLGEMPLANRLLRADQLEAPEPRYPLDLAFCAACCMVQVTTSVDPSVMFTDYPYFTSTSSTMVRHAQELVDRMVTERNLGPDDLAIEIASNDGYLLRSYVEHGVPVLGIDPAANVVEVALAQGVASRVAFFGPALAEELRTGGKRASVLHANNVLAHVPDINGVVRGIARVLADDGVAIFETPYVRDLIDRVAYDTIYHEHLFTYSLTSMTRLFARDGLRIVDVERLAIHGGSLRVFAVAIDATHAANVPAPSPAVAALLEEEATIGLTTIDYYRDFARRVEEAKHALRELVSSLRGQGHRIAAYGAAAKGAVLLNAAGFDADVIEFVADRSEHKQGLFMPGVHIPIVGPDQLLAQMPEEVLLLAWNLADEVQREQSAYRERGGRFILPGPAPMILS